VREETGPTPGHNIHMLLPSGVEVIGIGSWVERFAKTAVPRAIMKRSEDN
jgi:hypothetical protein